MRDATSAEAGKSQSCCGDSGLLRTTEGHAFAMTKLMTSHEAYLAMYSFLDAYYRRGKVRNVATLLGALAILPDGNLANPAFKGDWDKAVAAVLNETSHADYRVSGTSRIGFVAALSGRLQERRRR
jgi:hypothetical protein